MDINLIERKKIIKEFYEKGFFLKKFKNKLTLNKIRKLVYEKSLEILSLDPGTNDIDSFFNKFHTFMSIEDLNQFKLKLINEYSKNKKLNFLIYELIKETLWPLIGRKICMQRAINLIISMPRDKTGSMAIHTDTWGGNSPYEIILWLPLVNCYGTKSLFILDRKKTARAMKNIRDDTSVTEIERSVSGIKNYPSVEFGEALILSGTNLHGSSINAEHETRWSFNVRFKSTHTPFGTKCLGETFLPLELAINNEYI